MPDFGDIPFVTSAVSSVTANVTNTVASVGSNALGIGIGSVTSTIGQVQSGYAGLQGLLNGNTTGSGFPVVPGFQPGITENLPGISSSEGDWGPDLSTVWNNPDSTKNLPTEFKKSMGVGATESDQRVLSIRPRSAKTLYENSGKDTYTSDRGPITKMRLLKGPDADPAGAVDGANVDVDDDVSALLSDNGFINFFLTDLQASFNEKSQVTMTFGDNEVVYYFGRQPIMFNISGILLDSMENDWFAHFLTLYAGILRGTELAKNFSLVEITFPTMVVTGTISGLNVSQNAARDTEIPFSMQFIAKEVLPLPAAYNSDSPPSNLSGTLVDFNANRSGVAGYTLSSGTLAGGFLNSVSQSVGNLSSSLSSLGGLGDALSGVTGAASAVSNTLNSFRTNIFSPVFGIISSITKIVKSTTGTIASIVSSFTNPVNAVLRDITNIATQASAVANLVESSINSVISIPARTVTNFNNTLSSLKGAAGTISRVPENISESFRRLYGTGRIHQGAAILSSGKKITRTKTAVLSSGSPYIPSKSNHL